MADKKKNNNDKAKKAEKPEKTKANDDKETKPSWSGKGKAFFERAEQVADTGNWDFAIEMYVDGIQREPDNIERGHQPLREVALQRKATGAKGPGFREQFKRRHGKDPVVNLANASYLLAKEPGSVNYMQQVLKFAKQLELNDVAKWICDILMESQRQAKRANMGILLKLIESYHDLEQFALAIQACEKARELSPDDPKLHDAMNELSAKYTIKAGKYDVEGDFTKGVANLEDQQRLMQVDSLVKERGYLEEQIERARKDYLDTPLAGGKINALAEALCKIEEEAFENEAIDILKKAFKDTGAYQFRLRIGDIRIRQMTRRYQALRAAGDKEGAVEHARKQLEFETEEFLDRVANYPTDLTLKFELGKRQFLGGDYDAAIGSLQQAQRDPRRHLTAMSYLGQSFARKGWFREAADTYDRALQAEMTEDRGKELRYQLGDVLLNMGEYQRAQDCFSEVAQIDFNYKEVRTKLETARAKLDEEEKKQDDKQDAE